MKKLIVVKQNEAKKKSSKPQEMGNVKKNRGNTNRTLIDEIYHSHRYISKTVATSLNGVY